MDAHHRDARRPQRSELRRPEPRELVREPVGRELTDANAERRRLGAAICIRVGIDPRAPADR